ncbi:hypothetical protein C8Q79DRAFT_203934 [Trametes meyenii]|nr:hypothetical protein C8Q79DRAFT_203934 [Trametes meyenii]
MGKPRCGRMAREGETRVRGREVSIDGRGTNERIYSRHGHTSHRDTHVVARCGHEHGQPGTPAKRGRAQRRRDRGRGGGVDGRRPLSDVGRLGHRLPFTGFTCTPALHRMQTYTRSRSWTFHASNLIFTASPALSQKGGPLVQQNVPHALTTAPATERLYSAQSTAGQPLPATPAQARRGGTVSVWGIQTTICSSSRLDTGRGQRCAAGTPR